MEASEEHCSLGCIDVIKMHVSASNSNVDRGFLQVYGMEDVVDSKEIHDIKKESLSMEKNEVYQLKEYLHELIWLRYTYNEIEGDNNKLLFEPHAPKTITDIIENNNQITLQQQQQQPCNNTLERLLRLYDTSHDTEGNALLSKTHNFTDIHKYTITKDKKLEILYTLTKHQQDLEYTLRFNPERLSNPVHKKFVIYQLLHAIKTLHSAHLIHGNISLNTIFLTLSPYIWVQLGPGMLLSRYNKQIEFPDRAVSDIDSEDAPMNTLLMKWQQGELSNYDYLMALNELVGRSSKTDCAHSYYPILPWVTDFSHPGRKGLRDLTKSKFRLCKGDVQLDFTYNNTTPPHHITESFSELTYFMYMARRTELSTLKKMVRTQFVPGEYPRSVSRLYSWTPDECIPEFYTDPSVFSSRHTAHGLLDLELPEWCNTAEEFILWHRSMLESDEVSRNLHHWIDIIFGYKLNGDAAIDAKNVFLKVNDPIDPRNKHVQLFKHPHPCKYVKKNVEIPKLVIVSSDKVELDKKAINAQLINVNEELSCLEEAGAFNAHFGKLQGTYSIKKFISHFNDDNKNNSNSDKDNNLYEYEFDLFSIGCIIAELYLNKPLFNDRQLYLYLNNDFFPNISALPTQIQSLIWILLSPSTIRWVHNFKPPSTCIILKNTLYQSQLPYHALTRALQHDFFQQPSQLSSPLSIHVYEIVLDFFFRNIKNEKQRSLLQCGKLLLYEIENLSTIASDNMLLDLCLDVCSHILSELLLELNEDNVSIYMKVYMNILHEISKLFNGKEKKRDIYIWREIEKLLVYNNNEYIILHFLSNECVLFLYQVLSFECFSSCIIPNMVFYILSEENSNIQQQAHKIMVDFACHHLYPKHTQLLIQDILLPLINMLGGNTTFSETKQKPKFTHSSVIIKLLADMAGYFSPEFNDKILVPNCLALILSGCGNESINQEITTTNISVKLFAQNSTEAEIVQKHKLIENGLTLLDEILLECSQNVYRLLLCDSNELLALFTSPPHGELPLHVVTLLVHVTMLVFIEVGLPETERKTINNNQNMDMLKGMLPILSSFLARLSRIITSEGKIPSIYTVDSCKVIICTIYLTLSNVMGHSAVRQNIVDCDRLETVVVSYSASKHKQSNINDMLFTRAKRKQKKTNRIDSIHKINDYDSKNDINTPIKPILQPARGYLFYNSITKNNISNTTKVTTIIDESTNNSPSLSPQKHDKIHDSNNNSSNHLNSLVNESNKGNKHNDENTNNNSASSTSNNNSSSLKRRKSEGKKTNFIKNLFSPPPSNNQESSNTSNINSPSMNLNLKEFKMEAFDISSFITYNSKSTMNRKTKSNMIINDVKCKFTIHDGSIFSLACHPFLSIFASGGKDSTVNIWNVNYQASALEHSCTFHKHKYPVLQMGFLDSFSHISNQLYSCDHCIHIWDVETNSVLRSLAPKSFEGYITAIDSDEDKGYLALGTQSGTLRFWDLRTGKVSLPWMHAVANPLHISVPVRSVCVNKNQQYIATALGSGDVTIFDQRTGVIRRSFKAHEGRVLKMIILDNDHILTSGADRRICVWNIRETPFLTWKYIPADATRAITLRGDDIIIAIGHKLGIAVNVALVKEQKTRSFKFSWTGGKQKSSLTAICEAPFMSYIIGGNEDGAFLLME